MRHHLGSRGSIVFQHFLDQINSTARGIELIAVEHISGTGRGAKATMHAGAQDLFRFRDIRIGKLRDCKIGLHDQNELTTLHAGPHAAGIENTLRIETFAHALRQSSKRRRLRSKHVDFGTNRGGRADQHRMTAALRHD